MNEIIKELYSMEERASEILAHTSQQKQEQMDKKKEQEEQIEKGLQAEMEGRLTILRTQMEEQAEQEIKDVIQKNAVHMEELDEEYDGNYEKKAQEILKRITEV